MATPIRGRVINLKTQPGFLFIQADDTSLPNVFAHFRKLSPELPFSAELQGRFVECTIEEAEKGLRAIAAWPAGGAT